jgi:muramidase (phage lysozyme)
MTVLSAGQKNLLNLIGDTEAPQGYGTVYGNNQRKLAKPLTQWTISEIINANPGFYKRFGSSACGRYQFMRDTLKSLVAKAPALEHMVFTPSLQDELGGVLLRNRGYMKFIAGEMSPTAFGKALAQEWASFPVLANTQGAHRAVRVGETYYAGDALNKALISPTTVLKALAECRELDADTEDAPARGIMSVSLDTIPAREEAPDPGEDPVEVAKVDPTLIAPATPLKGLLSLFQGRPPVTKEERKEVTAQTKEEVPSLMKDLSSLRTVGLIGGVGSMLGGAQDSGLLDSVKSSADNATATFQSVQSLTNIILSAVKWGVQHWWLFGLGLTVYVLIKVGWAIFKVYVYVRNNIRAPGE